MRSVTATRCGSTLEDAEKLHIEESGLVRISTRIGHFVIQAWQTEGIRPGVVAASHHMGRWRLDETEGRNWAAGKATIDQQGTTWTLKREGADKKNMTSYESSDPDTGRIWWHDTGVHQNATFCVQPDPISGMQCWHQRVHVTPARSRRRVRRCRRRHRKVARGLPRLDGQDASRRHH